MIIKFIIKTRLNRKFFFIIIRLWLVILLDKEKKIVQLWVVAMVLIECMTKVGLKLLYRVKCGIKYVLIMVVYVIAQNQKHVNTPEKWETQENLNIEIIDLLL